MKKDLRIFDRINRIYRISKEDGRIKPIRFKDSTFEFNLYCSSTLNREPLNFEPVL